MISSVPRDGAAGSWRAWNDWVTSGAASKAEFPAWAAVIVQVPGATVVTEPAAVTVHTPGVPELNTTASPDDAAADTENVALAGSAASGPKVIVCPRRAGPLGTDGNDCVTSGAAAKSEFPAWAAVIVQVPGATVVTEPAAVTVHTPGVPELNTTASPDDAAADTENVVPAGSAASGPKVIVCPPGTADASLDAGPRRRRR